MKEFYRESGEIFRLKVPFENIYTSVFLIFDGKATVLIDCATTPSDVTDVIIPALSAMGLTEKSLTHIVITHKHGDHAGGLKKLLELNPGLTVIDRAGALSENLEVYPMYGHTKDCVGVLDLRVGTLVSGDGLQGYGVDKYRCSLESKEEYVKTLERIKSDERISSVLFSHAYEPWNKDVAFGREEVEGCLNDCISTVQIL